MDELIELREQWCCPVFLSRAEAAELRSLNMEVIGAPSLDERNATADGASQTPVSSVSDDLPNLQKYSVNPCCRVGHFRLKAGGCRTVRVEPKVAISNVFSLLGAAYGFYSHPGPFRTESVGYALDRATLLGPLVRHFNSLVKTLLQDGLLARQVEQEDNLKVLRGRIAFPRHVPANAVRQDRLYCRFFQAEVDIPENQVILWTLTLLNQSGEWCSTIRQTLHSHILRFGGVTLRLFSPGQRPTFQYDRLSSRYADVHLWCGLFIDLLSLSDRSGAFTFNGYLLDMNELFERFVVSVFDRARRVVPSMSVVRHERSRLDLDNKIGICPDITVRGPKDCIVAVDAKYKRTQGGGQARHPDLYQIIAYATALGLIGQESTPMQGLLVYPVGERTFELEGSLRVITGKRPSSELTIRVLWLDLNCPDPVRDAERRVVSLLDEISQYGSMRSPGLPAGLGKKPVVVTRFDGS